MMLLLSLTFLAAEWTARWRLNRAALTHRPLQCFSIVVARTHTHTHALPLIRTNMSVYQLQSTHLPWQLPGSRVKNAANEKYMCACVDKKAWVHTHSQTHTHRHTLYRLERSERWAQQDDLVLPPGQRSWVHIIQSYSTVETYSDSYRLISRYDMGLIASVINTAMPPFVWSTRAPSHQDQGYSRKKRIMISPWLFTPEERFFPLCSFVITLRADLYVITSWIYNVKFFMCSWISLYMFVHFSCACGNEFFIGVNEWLFPVLCS